MATPRLHRHTDRTTRGLRIATSVLLAGSALLGAASAAAAPSERGTEASSSSSRADGDHRSSARNPHWPEPPEYGTNDTAGHVGDFTGDGANVHGVYDAVVDGTPPENGQGNAQPCAGCVGNADNKNPQGQQPGPQDDNNGYECDGNQGIAKTNPAHTGCAAPATTTTTAAPTTTTTAQVTTTTQPGSTTSSQPSTTTTQPGSTTTLPGTSTTLGAQVLGEQFEQPAAGVLGDNLARTGSSVALLLAIAAAMLALGTVAITVTRRRRTSTTD